MLISKSEFVGISNAVHCFKYDYSMVEDQPLDAGEIQGIQLVSLYNIRNNVSATVEGYLTAKKLKEALVSLFGSRSLVGTEVTIGEHKNRRFDMLFDLHGERFLVEYDGNSHYQNPDVILRDEQKIDIAEEAEATLVRIPYFVQLTELTLAHYFGVAGKVEQSYPHGFIDSKHLPASFCEMGQARFAQEMEDLPESVRNEIVKSLEAKAAKLGIQAVLPSKMVRTVTETGKGRVH